MEENRQYKEAIKAYEQALTIDPNFAEAWAELGITYKNSGDLKKALKAFEKALKLNSKVPPYWFHYGTTLSEVGKLKQAANAIQEGLKLDSSIVKAWMDLHDVYNKMGNTEKAGWAMRKAMSTGKVDIAFAGNEDEAISQIKDWSNEQNKKEAERSALVERRVFPSWSFRVPLDFEEQPDGNRIQLISPDGKLECYNFKKIIRENS
ncbi:MAG: tetratricopeptide repeat protein [Candidatus Hermodarchaeota archaeon]